MILIFFVVFICAALAYPVPIPKPKFNPYFEVNL